MSELLLHWINHDIELSSVVINIESSFANGFLFGEILHRLNQQPNFSDFVDNKSSDAKIVNYCLLEPTMRGLNIKFTAKIASAIMNERAGVAANVLYQLKIVAERLKRSRLGMARLKVSTADARAILPFVNFPTKNVKHVYDEANHKLFEYSIRRHMKITEDLEEIKLQKQREQDKLAEIARRKEQESALLEEKRAERLHQAFIHSQFIKVALDETDSPAWRAALEKKRQRELRRANFFKKERRQRQHKAEQQLFSLRESVAHELDEFDTQQRDVFKSKNKTLFSLEKTLGYGLRSLSTALKDSEGKTLRTRTGISMALAPSGTGSESDKLLQRIKQQREERIAQSVVNERRRKQFLQQCLQHQHKFLETRSNQSLQEMLTRESRSELEAKEQMENVLKFREIAIENRQRREEMYSQQRRTDADREIATDSALYELLQHNVHDETIIQSIKQQKFVTASQAASHHANVRLAHGIVSEMLDFVLQVAQVREDTLHTKQLADEPFLIDPHTWKEKKTLLVSGNKPVMYSRPFTPQEQAEAEAEAETESATTAVTIQPRGSNGIPEENESVKTLNDSELKEYLASFREPCVELLEPPEQDITFPRVKFVASEHLLPDHVVLGESIKYVRWLTARQETPQSSPRDPVVAQAGDGANDTLKVLIFGRPFAGKQTQARLLADKYQLTVLSMHDLVEKALANASSSELGMEAAALLSKGLQIPESLYSRLLVEAIQDLSHSKPTPEGPEGLQLLAQRKGWVVYDLMGTAAQGKNLEEYLTNFVDPKLASSLDDFESYLAPGFPRRQLPADFLFGKSGLDIVFDLQLEAPRAFERCLNKVQDVASGEEFHLVYEPPEANSTERHRLRHLNESVFASEHLALQCTANERLAEENRAWYHQFGILRTIDSQQTSTDETHELLVHEVERLFEQRQSQLLEKQQELREREEGMMLKEEERARLIAAQEASLTIAREEISKCQHAVKTAEEQKAKKDELMELRRAVEAAQNQLDHLVERIRQEAHWESLRLQQQGMKFCGHLTPTLAGKLAAVWQQTEHNFVTVMHQSFSQLRNLRHLFQQDIHDAIVSFCDGFLKRVDAKQLVLVQFQKLFNDVLEDLRFEDCTKEELHARTDILLQDLRQIIDQKHQQNLGEVESILSEGWKEHRSQLCAMVFQKMLQAECDRFRQSVQLLLDVFHAANGEILVDFSNRIRSFVIFPEICCNMFRFHVEEEENAAHAAVTGGKDGKSKEKGKAKPTPAAAAAAAAANAAAMGDNTTDELEHASLEKMAHSYEEILQRCESLVASVMPTSTTDANEQDDNTPRSTPENAAIQNLRHGLLYESSLFQRRIGFLRDTSHAASQEIAQTMQQMESTLRQATQERKTREELAVAKLIQHIRTTIEQESSLPFWISLNSSPAMYRFPSTLQLEQDTMVQELKSKRWIPRNPPEPLPVVEQSHELVCNERQRTVVLDSLTQAASCFDDSCKTLPRHLFVQVMSRLSCQDQALPQRWTGCAASTLQTLAQHFTLASVESDQKDDQVDIEAFVHCIADVNRALWLKQQLQLH